MKSEAKVRLEFVRAADASLSAVQHNPEAYPSIHQQVRRTILRKFPHALFYLPKEDAVVVIACFRVKRSSADCERRV